MNQETALSSVPPEPERSAKRLDHLAADIRELNFSLFRTSLDHARRIGEKLLEAKPLHRGEFLAWAHDSCGIGSRSAQGYMRLASNWPAIEEWTAANTQPVAPLTIKQALAIVAVPREERSDKYETTTIPAFSPSRRPDSASTTIPQAELSATTTPGAVSDGSYEAGSSRIEAVGSQTIRSEAAPVNESATSFEELPEPKNLQPAAEPRLTVDELLTILGREPAKGRFLEILRGVLDLERREELVERGSKLGMSVEGVLVSDLFDLIRNCLVEWTAG